ncbi:Ribosomal protein S11 [Corchorus olitorius]|uniref:Ribosomal protein S11 n=1 Tax=Corchorus olitorius TaxID=93759 RepID=A0A1R3KWK7_9ROSI|nr:Ribosomal protein S11 [Corchorus olitorius]
MYPLSSIRQARLFSASALLQRFSSFNPSGGLRSFNFGAQPPENVGNLDNKLDQERMRENLSAPFASRFQSFTPSSGQRGFEMRGNFNSMNFVRDAIAEDGRGFPGASQPRYNLAHDADIVHINLKRNNSFVTVTDSKGNKKCGASNGQLSELKGGASRYAAEAIAEHVGRMARNMGVKSVVVRVKGFTHFRKKRHAIMSFREGFGNTRSGQNPVVYIEDTTRRPHNGCRLPKKRRI